MESSLHHVSPVKGHDTDQAAVIQTTVNRRTLQTLSRQLIVGFTHDDKTSETERQYKKALLPQANRAMPQLNIVFGLKFATQRHGT